MAKTLNTAKQQTETHVVHTEQGDLHITSQKGTPHRGITVLLEEPQDAVREGAQGFVNFLREKAIVGLAVGFIIGQQAQAVVKQLVDSFISPFLNILVGAQLKDKIITVGQQKFTWGLFAYVLINFFIVILAIYILVKLFKLDKLDKPKVTVVEESAKKAKK